MSTTASAGSVAERRPFVPQKLARESLASAIDRAIKVNAELRPEHREMIAKMYNRFRDRLAPVLRNGTFEPFAWIELIGDMMTMAKKFKAESAQKKQIVLEVLHLVIENDVPEEYRDSVRSIVDISVSPAIDLAIYFSQNDKCRKLWCGCC